MQLRTTLRNHQEEAAVAIRREFTVSPRTTLIMPCGTGKTLVAAAIAADYENILLQFPSISLIRQTLEVWRKEGLTANKNLLVVCSDKQVASADDVIVSEEELGCHITTGVEEAKAFFQRAKDCLIFTTYHSSAIVKHALPTGFCFDIGIADEAHRTAQDNDSPFALALDDNNIPCARRLFMTATPRFGALGERADGFAMNNEQVYGRICHQLSHREAVERNLICEIKTVIGVTSHNELRGFLNQASKGNSSAIVNIGQAIAIKRAMENFGIKKVVTFHRTIAEAQHFSAQENVRRELGVPCFFIHGKMSAKERHRITKEFEEAESAVMSNARCLTEGIDIPDIDMVAFMSPKRSVIDVVQAVGRSSRIAPNKSAGYVLIPLVATLDDGQIDKAQFNEVFHILTSLIEEASVIAYKTGERTTNYSWRKAVSEQLGDYTILSDDIDPHTLREQISVYCESRSSHTFDHWYPLLQAQLEQHGHLLSGAQRSPEQVEWERYIRAVHREGRLSAEKERLLTAINFQWARSQSDRWDEQYETLKASIGGKKDKRTNRFVAEQRALFKDGKLSPERARKLQALGIVLGPQKNPKSDQQADQRTSAPEINQTARIDELKRMVTGYDRSLAIHLPPEAAAQFARIKDHYQKLLAQHGGEAVIPLAHLSKLLSLSPATLEKAITNREIPKPVVSMADGEQPGWSLMHVCGIAQGLGAALADHDHTRAWYAMLLKEELARTKRS